MINNRSRKLNDILSQAARVFCERGYHAASMRDVARAADTSLAGLYYYVSGKEHLLYLIQRNSFETLLANARGALGAASDPEQRLRAIIRLHLGFFLEHPSEMKVLTHEEHSLEEAWRREIHALRKAYYQLAYEQVERLAAAGKLRRINPRIAVLSLFGMMNWIYMWYRPGSDPEAESLAEAMAEMFFLGVRRERSRAKTAVRGRERAAGAFLAANALHEARPARSAAQ